MFLYLNLVLFVATFIGGSIPFWYKHWNEKGLKNLLAFSGAFLLSITLLHLLPVSFKQDSHTAGILIIAGFFLQQIIQVLTHGVEHGHSHGAHNHGASGLLPIFAGLGLHAFSEGLPLGINYADDAVTPSLYLAVILHKLPEAMVVASIMVHLPNRKLAWLLLAVFAAITPFAGLLTAYLGTQFSALSTWISYCIPFVAGIFIHIATTIFFESGTKAHEMNWKRWLVILTGIGTALLTTIGHTH